MPSKHPASDENSRDGDAHKVPRRDQNTGGAADAEPAVAEAQCGVELPAVYVLERRHVEAALAGARTDMDDRGGLTLWIHQGTVGIDRDCFGQIPKIDRVSRILTRREPEHIVAHPSPTAAVMGALIRRICLYEPDLVDLIHEYATHNVDKVHCVGERAFRECTGLTKVTLPSTLIYDIQSGVFFGCTALMEVTLPNTLTHIGNLAFSGCTGLTKAALPNTLTHIGNGAFEGCTGLTEVTLPTRLIHIGNYAFQGCVGLTEVTLPNTLTRIEHRVFSDCTGLMEVTLPNALTHIGASAFRECIGLIEVMLPNTLTHIEDWAFYGCARLTEVTLPDTLPHMGTHALDVRMTVGKYVRARGRPPSSLDSSPRSWW